MVLNPIKFRELEMSDDQKLLLLEENDTVIQNWFELGEKLKLQCEQDHLWKLPSKIRFASEEKPDHYYNLAKWKEAAQFIKKSNKFSDEEKMQRFRVLYCQFCVEYFPNDDQLVGFTMKQKIIFVINFSKLGLITGPCGKLYDFLHNAVGKMSVEIARNKLMAKRKTKSKRFTVKRRW